MDLLTKDHVGRWLTADGRVACSMLRQSGKLADGYVTFHFKVTPHGIIDAIEWPEAWFALLSPGHVHHMLEHNYATLVTDADAERWNVAVAQAAVDKAAADAAAEEAADKEALAKAEHAAVAANAAVATAARANAAKAKAKAEAKTDKPAAQGNGKSIAELAAQQAANGSDRT